MAQVFDNNCATVGRTPMVRLHRLASEVHATVLGKLECRNPSGSVKARPGIHMIADAEERGALQRGMEIVEPTSGNMGIALAFAAAAKGYAVTLTMPDTMSVERRKLLAALGAQIVLTPGAEGMAGAIRRAEELLAEKPEARFMPQQFKNPANPDSHEHTTGPEIWQDTDGDIDALVAGVGTGGTLTGIARYIKQTAGKPISIIAVEPEESPVISQHLAGQPLKPGPHGIQGIGAGFIPDTLDVGLIDSVIRVRTDEAYAVSRRLAHEEGILAGISSGAALAAALRLAAQPEWAGRNIVAILPDSGERYLSTDLFA